MFGRSTIITILFSLTQLNILAATDKHRLSDLPEAAPPKKAGLSDKSAAKKNPTASDLAITPEENKLLIDQVSDEFYQSGLREFNDGNLAQAESYFDRALAIKPTHKGAREKLNQIMKSYETPSPAPTPAHIDPKKQLVEKLQKQLSRALRDGDYETANTVAAKILAIDPQNKEAKKNVALINRELAAKAISRADDRARAEDYQGAVDGYRAAMSFSKDPLLKEKIAVVQEKLAEKNRKTSAELYFRALSASQNGQIEEALRLSKESLALDPKNFQAKRMVERLSPANRQ